MTIHKAGYTNIAICILIIFLLNAVIQFYAPQAFVFKWLVYILSLVFFAGTIWFFRDPAIEIITNDKAILSPADGIVTAITQVDENEFAQGSYTKISITIALTDVRVNRSPMRGTIKHTQTNGHATVVIESKTGTIIVYRQLPGYTKHLVTYASKGGAITQGDQLGFAMGGSNVEVMLPADSPVSVQVNDAVKSGQTVLAKLKSS